ncbi:hypothetical protein [Terracoccus luteus]|uniref:Oxidoreductase n=1 Tax=Terracoccus luteus TaxID=53356 RepID=A0A839PRF8_9MICO|nr:hypothetical protein [Terracoccus luteus]MBB2986097.1 hypothetical protein [Terracoccus luteus]MCP2171749.1 hypothetical protein [Terracoccus luteus]
MTGRAFGLTPAERDLRTSGGFTTFGEGGQSKTPVTYLDFTMAGASVFTMLVEHAPADLDFVGVIQEAWPNESVAAIKRLLGDAPGDLPDGRVSLYTCPECGDLGCGAVTARLIFDADVVTWQAIGHQTDYDEAASALGNDVTFPDLVFDRASYEHVLRQEMIRIEPSIEGFEYPYQRERRERRERWERRARLFRRMFRPG